MRSLGGVALPRGIISIITEYSRVCTEYAGSLSLERMN